MLISLENLDILEMSILTLINCISDSKNLRERLLDYEVSSMIKRISENDVGFI